MTILACLLIAVLIAQQLLHQRERRELLTLRFERPDVTPVAEPKADPELLPAVSPDDDTDFWQSRGIEVPH